MDLTYEELKKEIDLMKSNQAVVLKEYGERVREFDSEISTLKKTKDQLVSDISNLENEKDTIFGGLSKESKKINEEAKALFADAMKGIEKLEKDRERLKKDIVEFEYKVKESNVDLMKRRSVIEAAEVDLQKRQEVVGAKEKETEDSLWGAHKHSKEMEAAKRRQLAVLAEFEEKVRKVNLEKGALEIQQRDLAILKNELLESKQRNIDINKKLEDYKKHIHEKWVVALDDLDKERVKYEQKYEELKTQAEDNKLRSVELDAGFSKLEQEKAYMAKEMKKLEGIKKQLSK